MKWGNSGNPPVFEAEATASDRASSFNSDAKAAVPMPALIRPKKCRRVNKAEYSSTGCICSFLRYHFVQIQDQAGDDRRRCQFARIQRRVSLRLADRNQVLCRIDVRLKFGKSPI